jgi:hypothetical protein
MGALAGLLSPTGSAKARLLKMSLTEAPLSQESNVHLIFSTIEEGTVRTLRCIYLNTLVDAPSSVESLVPPIKSAKLKNELCRITNEW